jgi:hypothetical protein
VTTKNATTATVTALYPPRMPFRNRRRSAPLASPRLPVAGTGTVGSVFEAIGSELGGATTVGRRAVESFDRSSLSGSRFGTSSNASVRDRFGDSRGLHWTELLTVDMSATQGSGLLATPAGWVVEPSPAQTARRSRRPPRPIPDQGDDRHEAALTGGPRSAVHDNGYPSSLDTVHGAPRRGGGHLNTHSRRPTSPPGAWVSSSLS